MVSYFVIASPGMDQILLVKKADLWLPPGGHYDINEFNQIHWFWIDEIPFEKSDTHMKRFLQKMSYQKNLMIDQVIEVSKWI